LTGGGNNANANIAFFREANEVGGAGWIAVQRREDGRIKSN
jgi:hypothetical protein